MLDRQHLGRLLNCPTRRLGRASSRAAIAASRLPIADGAYLNAPIHARLDGRAWRDRPISFGEAGGLLRHLFVACFILAAYLSGARPGEVLALRRGCVTRDPVTGLWLMQGRKWKGAVDENGNKRPEGEERADPWVVVKPAADAVAVLERLHDRPLLFPAALFDTRQARVLAQDRLGQAMTTQVLAKFLGQFAEWIDEYCTATGRDERIPADPSGKMLYPVRFRRTLAWHIVRRPRGLAAAAIQYAHVYIGVTLGYSGTYASGFPTNTPLRPGCTAWSSSPTPTGAYARASTSAGQPPPLTPSASTPPASSPDAYSPPPGRPATSSTTQPCRSTKGRA